MAKNKYLLLFILSTFFHSKLFAQKKSSEIYHDLQKLNTLGRALYLAAHPDDENTRLISFLANEEKVKTAYLSLTRGDGGQNLIGDEKGVLLGLIRTNELLEARKVDGGQQFFSSAYDFGFSKTADETIDFWGKDLVMEEMVYIIRKFKPDVIINRFPTSDNYGGHGHHKAASILSIEAFDLAADPKVYPHQVAELGTWKTERLLFNASTWWKADLAEHYKDNPNFIKIDVGNYNPLLGISYPEMAADSRTMHKSQGFGSMRYKGETPEYLEWLKGSKPENTILDNINTTWTRVKGGEKIAPLLEAIIKSFDFNNPEKSLKALLNLKNEIQKLPENHFKAEKIIQINEIIENILGLEILWFTDDYLLTKNEAVKSKIELINRSDAKVIIKSFSFNEKNTELNKALENNQLITEEWNFTVSNKSKFDQPFWLENEKSFGHFNSDKDKFYAPKLASNTFINLQLEIEGELFELKRNLQFRKVDPVRGEIRKPVYIVPKVSVKALNANYIFTNKNEKKITLEVLAYQYIQQAEISFSLPKGVEIKPATLKIENLNKLEKRTYDFEIITKKSFDEIVINPLLKIGEETFSQTVNYIDYEHIEPIVYIEKAAFKIKNPGIEVGDKKIGYIMGAGDELPKILNNLGYQVDLLNDDEITFNNLKKYDVVITGIRAFNTREVLAYAYKDLHQFAENGGKLIVQYNVNRSLKTENVLPFPIKFSRNRVTEEDAKVEFLAKNHPVLNHPHQLKESDFDAWVQERGLYFPETWDENYTPILAMNDKGENISPGSLIVADYGKGKVLYTGISFFRQLPAGVSGAYKLFVNLIEY